MARARGIMGVTAKPTALRKRCRPRRLRCPWLASSVPASARIAVAVRMMAKKNGFRRAALKAVLACTTTTKQAKAAISKKYAAVYMFFQSFRPAPAA